MVCLLNLKDRNSILTLLHQFELKGTLPLEGDTGADRVDEVSSHLPQQPSALSRAHQVRVCTWREDGGYPLCHCSRKKNTERKSTEEVITEILPAEGEHLASALPQNLLIPSSSLHSLLLACLRAESPASSNYQINSFPDAGHSLMCT